MFFTAIEKIDENTEIRFLCACFGFAELDLNYDYNIYKNIVFNNKLKNFFNPKKTQIYNDTKIGLAAGSNEKNAIIINCGTGSICYGVNDKGKEARSDGWDYILGY